MAVRIGVVGKGGAGKTTLAALLVGALTAAGRRVVAVDTDSNPNLGLSLGLSPAEADAVPVLPRAVLVGAPDGETVQGLVTAYGRPTPVGAVLLSALRVSQAGAGCTCGGHATVRSLLGAAFEETADAVVVDMEAGLEHLSRAGGTLAHVDVLLVVIEPSRKSALTAARTVALATELGIRRVLAVGNKARDAGDEELLEAAAAEAGVPLAGVLPYAEEVARADRSGTALAGASPDRMSAALAPLLAAVDAAVPPVSASLT